MSAFLISLLIGCSEDPTISGTVKDIWNNPVEGVSVMMEGVSEDETSDSTGAFTFAIPEGKEGKLRFRANHEKYLYDVEMVSYSKDLEQQKSLCQFQLISQTRSQRLLWHRTPKYFL